MQFVIFYKRIKKIIRNIIFYIFPFLNLFYVSKDIKKEECNANYFDVLLLNCTKQDIINKNQNAFDLKKLLEDKAKSSLLAITISITLFLNLYKFLENISLFTLLLIFYCIISMVIAGIISIINLSENNLFYDLTLNDYLLEDIKLDWQHKFRQIN